MMLLGKRFDPGFDLFHAFLNSQLGILAAHIGLIPPGSDRYNDKVLQRRIGD